MLLILFDICKFYVPLLEAGRILLQYVKGPLGLIITFLFLLSRKVVISLIESIYYLTKLFRSFFMHLVQLLEELLFDVLLRHLRNLGYLLLELLF